MQPPGSDNSPLCEMFYAIACDDKQSFDKLFHLYYTKLVNFSNDYVKSRESAEDIVSELFVRLWLGRAKLKEIKSPGVYLFTAVKNASLNNIRNLSNTRIEYIEEQVLNEKIASISTPEDQLETKEIFLQLEKAIEALPPQSRTILRLVKEDGFKCREVAEILQISVRSVENQLYRAVCKLDASLSPYLTKGKKNKNNPDKILSLFWLLPGL